MEPLWTVFSCCYFYRQDFIRYANAARRSWPGIQAAGRGMAWKKNNRIKVLGLKITKLACLKAGVYSYSTPCIFGSRLPALAKLNSLNYSAMEGKLNVWHIYWNMMCLSVSELRGVMERGRYSVGPRNVCVGGILDESYWIQPTPKGLQACYRTYSSQLILGLWGAQPGHCSGGGTVRACCLCSSHQPPFFWFLLFIFTVWSRHIFI